MMTLARTTTAALLLACATAVHAQTAAVPSEDVEPRVIGTAGTLLIGLSGYVDQFFSSEQRLPFNYSAQIDGGRFLTNSFVVRGGLRGTGSVGGDDAEDLATGSGAPALHAFGGFLYYLTPQSLVSMYTGGEYWAQLTQRRSPDAGSVVGVFGVQGALSSRASLFVEAGYGLGLRKNDDEVRVTRIVGQIGVRLRF
jgi:opacity protein-like surface antigen